eukprot:TRINITY_DN1799_c1_g1_i1.p1 TRINITY_DN1799_c1_g1~~TRINITY_DN1799_c1_g1_i1.p1  ORF type:complete len:883 (-),score=238.29 TRINITY_DN1799_c1_g1_i1:189-2837(-)
MDHNDEAKTIQIPVIIRRSNNSVQATVLLFSISIDESGVFRLEVTSEEDLSFFYHIDLRTDEYAKIRSEHVLECDFSQFPRAVWSILGVCDVKKPNGEFAEIVITNAEAALLRICRSRPEAFSNDKVLSLPLKLGNDKRVIKHLCSRIRSLKESVSQSTKENEDISDIHDTIQDKLKRTEEEVEHLKQKIQSQAEKHLEELKVRAEQSARSLDERLKIHESDYGSLRNKFERLSEDHSNLRTEFNSQSREIIECRGTCDKMNAENGRLKDQIQELISRNQRIESEKDRQTTLVQDRQRDIDGLQSEMKVLRAKLQEAETARSKEEEMTRQLQNGNEKLNEVVQTQHDEQTRIMESFKRNRRELVSKRNECERLCQQVEALERNRQLSIATQDDLKQKIQQQGKEQIDTQKKLGESDLNNMKNQQKIEELSNLLDASRQKISELQQVILHLESERNSLGIVGSFGSGIGQRETSSQNGNFLNRFSQSMGPSNMPTQSHFSDHLPKFMSPVSPTPFSQSYTYNPQQQQQQKLSPQITTPSFPPSTDFGSTTQLYEQMGRMNNNGDENGMNNNTMNGVEEPKTATMAATTASTTTIDDHQPEQTSSLSNSNSSNKSQNRVSFGSSSVFQASIHRSPPIPAHRTTITPPPPTRMSASTTHWSNGSSHPHNHQQQPSTATVATPSPIKLSHSSTSPLSNIHSSSSPISQFPDELSRSQTFPTPMNMSSTPTKNDGSSSPYQHHQQHNSNGTQRTRILPTPMPMHRRSSNNDNSATTPMHQMNSVPFQTPLHSISKVKVPISSSPSPSITVATNHSILSNASSVPYALGSSSGSINTNSGISQKYDDGIKDNTTTNKTNNNNTNITSASASRQRNWKPYRPRFPDDDK